MRSGGLVLEDENPDRLQLDATVLVRHRAEDQVRAGIAGELEIGRRARAQRADAALDRRVDLLAADERLRDRASGGLVDRLVRVEDDDVVDLLALVHDLDHLRAGSRGAGRVEAGIGHAQRHRRLDALRRRDTGRHGLRRGGFFRSNAVVGLQLFRRQDAEVGRRLGRERIAREDGPLARRQVDDDRNGLASGNGGTASERGLTPPRRELATLTREGLALERAQLARRGTLRQEREVRGAESLGLVRHVEHVPALGERAGVAHVEGELGDRQVQCGQLETFEEAGFIGGGGRHWGGILGRSHAERSRGHGGPDGESSKCSAGKVVVCSHQFAPWASSPVVRNVAGKASSKTRATWKAPGRRFQPLFMHDDAPAPQFCMVPYFSLTGVTTLSTPGPESTRVDARAIQLESNMSREQETNIVHLATAPSEIQVWKWPDANQAERFSVKLRPGSPGADAWASSATLEHDR